MHSDSLISRGWSSSDAVAKFGLQECVYLFFLCVNALMSLIFISLSHPNLSFQGVCTQVGGYRRVSFDVRRCVCLCMCFIVNEHMFLFANFCVDVSSCFSVDPLCVCVCVCVCVCARQFSSVLEGCGGRAPLLYESTTKCFSILYIRGVSLVLIYILDYVANLVLKKRSFLSFLRFCGFQ